jgi:hypothetical protein
MALTYTWGFPALGVTFNEDNLTNVISTVNWTLTAKEDNYVSSVYGSVGLAAPSPATFTPYDEVTEEQVQTWTEDAINAQGGPGSRGNQDDGLTNVERMKAGLAAQIETQKNPPSGNLPPPWVTPAA